MSSFSDIEGGSQYQLSPCHQWSLLWSSSSFLLIVCCNFGPLCGPHPHFTDHLLQFWSSLWSSSSFSLIVCCNYDPLMYPHPSALRRWMPSHDLAQKNRRGSGFRKRGQSLAQACDFVPFSGNRNLYSICIGLIPLLSALFLEHCDLQSLDAFFYVFFGVVVLTYDV